jgi:hypothetical protein
LTIEKINNQSGSERVEGFLSGITIFMNYPLLGVGYGQNRTFDFGTTLISSTGIFGFLSFFYFIMNILIKLRVVYRSNLNSTDMRIVSLSLFGSIIIGISSMLISVPDIVFLIIWVILGLSISLINISNMKQHQ